MEQKVYEYVTEYHMIEEKDRIILGVSGGADSICLFLVLNFLRKRIPFELKVVHVNHNLRGEEALRDQEYVRWMCQQYEIECEVFSVDVLSMSKQLKLGLEEVGRKVRYEAFERVKNTWNATKIALAHHQNDLAETMIYHLARGTGIAGLCSMKPVREYFIRPLLCCTRVEIEEYLQENHIKYMTDSTNLTDDYTRNKIRHKVVDVLSREVNGKTVMHMANTASQMEEIEEYLKQQVQKKEKQYLVMHKRTGTREVFIKQEISNEPPLIQKYVFKDALYDLTGKSKDIQTVHLEGLMKLMQKEVGSCLHLPHKVIAKKGYDGLSIIVQSLKVCQDEVPMIQSGKNTLVIENFKEWLLGSSMEAQFLTYQICISMQASKQEIIQQKMYTKWFDYDKIKAKLQFRTRQTGDFIMINSLGGKKKLKDYFINEKIPKDERDDTLLLADGSHIIWIVGYRISEYYKVTAQTTKILKIQVSGGNDCEL